MPYTIPHSGKSPRTLRVDFEPIEAMGSSSEDAPPPPPPPVMEQPIPPSRIAPNTTDSPNQTVVPEVGLDYAPQEVQNKYEGYQPLGYEDYMEGSNTHEEPLVEAVRTRSIAYEAEMTESERETGEKKIAAHLIANITLIVLAIAFTFCIIVLVPQVSCGMGICEITDRSVSGASGLSVFGFIAPLRLVWGALTAGVFGALMSCIHLYFLRASRIDGTAVLRTALQVRRGAMTYVKYEYFVVIIVIVPLFLLLGFGVSWVTSGAFLVGAIVSVGSGWSEMYFATYGSVCIARGAVKSFDLAADVMFRTAVSMGILGVALPVACTALAYIAFRDVRALLGLSAGVSLVAAMSRVSSGIYGAANDVAKRIVGELELGDAGDDPRNAASVAARVADRVDNAVGIGVDYLESLVAAVAVTAVAGASMPYVSGDSYAICVYNNLHIDHACVALANTTIKISHAATICRTGDRYKVFPSLSFMQSNSIFVAIPFLVALVGLLSAAVSTVHLGFLRIGNETPARDGQRIVRSVRLNTLLGAFLFMGGAVAITYGLVGPKSAFHDTLSKARFPREDLISTDPLKRCESRAIGVKLPVLNSSIGFYRPTNELGEAYPLAEETMWRLLAVILVGQFMAFLIDLWMRYFSGQRFSPTITVAKMGEYGAQDVITQGLGSALTSTSVPFLLVVGGAFGAHILLGTFGIGLAAVSMLAVSGGTLIASAFEPLAKSAVGILRLSQQGVRAVDAVEELEFVGTYFAITAKNICAGASLLVGIAIISDLMTVSGLEPSARQIIGSVGEAPVRHITTIDKLNALDPSVFVAVPFGVLLAVVFVALPLLGMSRTGYAVTVEARRQLRKISGLRDCTSTEGANVKKCVRISTRFAFFEMLLPVMMSLVVPLSIGFGFGQRALISMLCGATSSGYLLGVFLSTAGSTWQNAKIMVGRGRFGGDNGTGSIWYHNVGVADSVGVFLRRAGNPGLTIFVKLVPLTSLFAVRVMRPGFELWYVGLILSCVAGIILIILQILGHSYQKNIRKKASIIFGEEEEDELGAGQTAVTELRASPFMEEGYKMSRRRVAPGSALGHGRIEPSALEEVPIDNLKISKIKKRD